MEKLPLLGNEVLEQKRLAGENHVVKFLRHAGDTQKLPQILQYCRF